MPPRDDIDHDILPPIDWEKQSWERNNVEIAQALGISNSTVANHRPPDRPSPVVGRHKIEWADQPWATENDAEIARRLGLAKSVVGRYRPKDVPHPAANYHKRYPTINWNSVHWAINTNHEIALDLNVNDNVVAYHRPEMFPNPVSKLRKPKLRFATLRSNGQGIKMWIDWDRQPLGKYFDIELARRLRVTESTVRGARKVRGIASFSSSKPTARSDVARRAWKTKIEKAAR